MHIDKHLFYGMICTLNEEEVVICRCIHIVFIFCYCILFICVHIFNLFATVLIVYTSWISSYFKYPYHCKFPQTYEGDILIAKLITQLYS